MAWRRSKAIAALLPPFLRQQRLGGSKAAAYATAHQQDSASTGSQTMSEESMDFPGGKVPFTTQVQGSVAVAVVSRWLRSSVYYTCSLPWLVGLLRVHLQ